MNHHDLNICNERYEYDYNSSFKALQIKISKADNFNSYQ